MFTRHLLASAIALTAALSAQNSITTTFTSNNGGAAGWINFFDIDAQIGLAITEFDVNVSTGTGTIDVYITAPGGSYVGNEANPGLWTKVADSVSFTAAGSNQPSRATLNTPLILAPGSYGMGILYNGMSPRYTNGTGANQTYSNAEVTLNLGSSIAGQFSGTLFTPRVWNGTIYYSPSAGFARAIPYGTGCGGTGQALGLRGRARPVIGTQASAETFALPNNSLAAVMFLGLTEVPGIDLGPLGMTGCRLYASSEATFQFTPSGPTHTTAVTIPLIPALAGASLYLQSAAVDVGGNPLGVIASNGLEWVLDSQ